MESSPDCRRLHNREASATHGTPQFPWVKAPEGNIPAPVLSPKEIAVCHALLMLPYYGVFDNLEFRVDGDKVELLGQVTRPVLASDAQRAVAQVSGVNQVINHVEVLPLSPNDDRIRLSVYRKVYGSSSMLPYAV